MKQRVDRQYGAVGNDERVAIGGCAHERGDRDSAVGAGSVLDHYGLVQPLLQPSADDARYGVRQAAWSIWDNELDRLIWIGCLALHRRWRERGGYEHGRQSDERGT